MSVTELLKLPEVRERLGSLLPELPKRISVPLLAPPVTRNWGLVGTAFDYALRFELERRFPHARTKGWVAENSMALLDGHLAEIAPAAFSKQAEQVLTEAQAAHKTFIKSAKPAQEARAGMAAHAIRLAKLDVVYRAGRLDPTLTTADGGDIQDVLKLLDIVPYDVLGHPKTLWLNPTFGAYSAIVGGADADVISGDRLIDFKVTKNDDIEPKYALQLVSYALLSAAARTEDRHFPHVRTVGIYFARHAHLWSLPLAHVTEHPEYTRVADWYFDLAGKVYGLSVEDLIATKVAQVTANAQPQAKSKKKGASVPNHKK